MKIIHCADLHLDSKMTSNLSKEQAKERKMEILRTYSRMIEYAKNNDVKAIIIAGDLFDTRNVSATARNLVKDSITSNPDIDFYYLKGNHDSDNFISKLDEIPDNLKLFSNQWTSYSYGNITITGLEIDKSNQAAMYNSLVLDNDNYNVVTLHGQLGDEISTGDLKNKGIDYLALGHVHEYQSGQLDNRGMYCYSGCLEGRGFDECGKKGFVIIDIDKDGIKDHQFVSLARRELHQIKVEVEPEDGLDEIITKVKEPLSYTPEKDSVRVVLTGRKNMDLEIDCDWIKDKTDRGFFYMEVMDDTRTKVNYETFAHDRSLKGTFVRTVQGLDIDEEEKAKIIETGIRAIMEGSLIE